MTEQERLLAALEYQEAQRPALMNPNLMRQGQRMNLPARQAPGPMAEFVTQAMSLDPQPDQGLGTVGAEMGLSLFPGVGQAMGLRDVERGRRANDPVMMGLGAASLIPVGKLINALRGGKQMGPVSEMIKTDRGMIPETRVDVERLSTRLEKLAKQSGAEVLFDKSKISPSSYVSVAKTPESDFTTIRISNHKDYHGGNSLSVDPVSGNTFEDALRLIREQGIPIADRVKAPAKFSEEKVRRLSNSLLETKNYIHKMPPILENGDNSARVLAMDKHWRDVTAATKLPTPREQVEALLQIKEGLNIPGGEKMLNILERQ